MQLVLGVKIAQQSALFCRSIGFAVDRTQLSQRSTTAVREHVGGPHKNCRVTRAHSFLLPSFHFPRCFPLLLSFFSSKIYNLLARADATMECRVGALLLAACSWSGTSSLALRGGVWSGMSAARWSGADRRGGARRASHSELRARCGGVLPWPRPWRRRGHAQALASGGDAEPSE